MKSATAIFVIMGVCLAAQVYSQTNIVAAEYFYDTDPGTGNGTPIAVTAGTTINITGLNLPTTSLSIGWHTLCVRTKDSNNVWGFYECRSIFIRSAAVGPPPAPAPIAAMEYFFDNVTDPGTGQPVTITSGTAVAVTGLNIPQSLSQGWHTLNVRTRDQNNVWGFYETRSIYVRSATVGPPPPPPSITAAEYFFDNVTDPGTGQSITITPGTTINLSSLNLPQTLTQGWHTLNVRTKDQNNIWGFYETRSVFVRSATVGPPPPPPSVTTVEYFFDNVTAPGTGQTVTITPGTNVTVSGANITQSLAQGWHTIHMRAKDQNNAWGFYETRNFFVRSVPVNPPAPPNIVQFEYFVDTDPGVGQSTLTLTKPPSTLIDLPAEPLTVGALSLGSHILGMRAKDQNGTWSTTEERSFTVVSGCTGITAPTTTNDTRCNPGTLNLTASGATGSQTYRWYADNTTLAITYTGSPFTTPSLSVNTDYYVSIYDPTTYCESSRTKASAIVTGIPKPTLNLTGSLSVCQGNSVSLQAPVGFTSYLWSNGLTTQQITVATAGSYTVVVGNGTCQSPASDPFTFTVNPNPTKPIINATGGGSLCGTGSVTLSAPAGFSNYSWSSGESTQNIAVNSVGSFSVSVTDVNGCQSVPSNAFSVTSSALPKPIINVTGSTVICGSGTVQLSAPSGYSGYNWSDASTLQTDNVGPGSYTVTVSSGGCTSPASDPVVITSVTLPSKPTIAVTGNTSLCNGAFTVLSAPLGYSNYSWSDGSATRQIVVSTANNYTVQVGNASNCMSPASDPTVTTLTGASCGSNLPSSPSVSNKSRCGDGALSLTAAGANGNQTYNWYDLPQGNLLFTGSTFTTPTLSNTTDYYVTISDPLNGESNPTKATASIINIPTPVLNGPSTISLCSGSSTLLTAPSGFISYVWSNGSTTQNIQVVNVPGDYSVKVSDGTCTSSSSNVISVSISPSIPKPQISVSGNTTLCSSGTVQLAAPTGNGFTYSWSDGETLPAITTSSAGNYSVVISNGICTSPASDAINVSVTSVLPKPTISVTGKTILCSGEFSVLSAPTSSFYLWSTGETTQQIVVSTANSFTVQVGNSPNCMSVASDPIDITISGPCGVPNPIITNASRCGDGTLTLKAGGANNKQVYNWYDSPSGTLLFTGSNFVTPNLSSTTNYYVTIFDAANGESNPVKATATVVNIPAPVLAGPSSVTICDGNNIVLTAPSTYVGYLWSNNATTQNIQATTTGNYSVQVSDGTCTSPSSNIITVTVSPIPTKPKITIQGSTIFCADGSVDLSGPDGFTYLWSNQATSQKITVAETTVISLVVLNADGCRSPVSDPVAITKMLPPCKPNTAPVIAPIPISVKIEGSVSVDLTKYISDAEDNIDYTRLQLLTSRTIEGAPASIDAAYNLSIDYKGIPFSGTDRITLEVYDLFNLSAQRVLDIEVVGEVVPFNGVTPDGDGKNDFFYIQYLNVIQGGLKNKVTIFNRWGDIVFDISDYNNVDRVFTGLSNSGSQLPPGTYFYRIDLSDSKPVTGYLTLKH